MIVQKEFSLLMHTMKRSEKESLCATIVLISTYFLPPQERKTDEKMNLKDSIAVKCKLYGK